MKALAFSTFGPSEVLEYIDVPKPSLKPNQVLVQFKAIGLNFADIYRRNGNYHLVGQPPFIAGYEGSGIIVDNNNHQNFPIGTEVCFADMPLANAEFIALDIDKTILKPQEISFDITASIMLQGLTAQYLSHDSFTIEKDQIILVYACTGGVGQLLTQMAKMKGAHVIGLTSSTEKAVIAKENGVDEVYLNQDNWAEQILEKHPNGVDVVYDSVGITLLDSFKVAKETGTVVFYGFSGGNPPYIDPRMLMDGSKKLIGGDLWSYLTSAEERNNRIKKLFDWIISGKIKVSLPTSFKLSEGKAAHDYLESRKSTGKIILIP